MEDLESKSTITDPCGIQNLYSMYTISRSTSEWATYKIDRMGTYQKS